MRVDIDAVDTTDGKWYVRFVKLDGPPRYERRVGTVQSLAVFATSAEAIVRGQRAVHTYNTTNRFPDLTKPF